MAMDNVDDNIDISAYGRSRPRLPFVRCNVGHFPRHPSVVIPQCHNTGTAIGYDSQAWVCRPYESVGAGHGFG